MVSQPNDFVGERHPEGQDGRDVQDQREAGQGEGGPAAEAQQVRVNEGSF